MQNFLIHFIHKVKNLQELLSKLFLIDKYSIFNKLITSRGINICCLMKVVFSYFLELACPEIPFYLKHKHMFTV